MLLCRECPFILLLFWTQHAATAQALGREAETLALLDFKAAIQEGPHGGLGQWSNLTSPCTWNGIHCNGQGSVISITLSGRNLSGTISAASLASLPNLSTLNLSSNSLTGTLPSSLCAYNASSLTVLSLENNNLTGSIPPSLGNCTNLVHLSLYSNRLSGHIPSQLGVLARLSFLALSFNHLAGSFPTTILTNCTQLTILAFSLNRLTGPLPREISQLSNLQSLWGDNNLLSGRIPHEIGNLTNLTVLQLDNNEFTGPIPGSIGRLTSLSLVLSLSKNQLTGPIPHEVGNLTNLGIMTLMGNFLNGRIPKELGNMQSLQGLFLEDNMLEGPIPIELSNCTHLQRLKLYNNRLNGSVPDALSSLKHLTELSLHGNVLQGGIPLSFASLTTMQDLSLGYNHLSGHIPDGLASQLSGIVFNFSMPHNFLNGSIPPGLGQMIHVQNIDLSANTLSGAIPASIGHCTNMLSLNLSYNSLTGGIPDSFAGLLLIETIDLSDNFLSGPIPAFLAALPNLKYINLSHNNFTGQIPMSGVFATFNASSFVANPGLCGPPLPQVCTLVVVSTTPQKNDRLKVEFKVLIVLASICGIVLCLFLVKYTLCMDSQRRVEDAQILVSPSVPVYSKHFKQFTASELESATKKFDEACLIGTGGVSKVYKGTKLTIQLAPSIKQVDVAIKLLYPGHRLSFGTELETLGSIRHRNLVRMYGYCDTAQVQALALELLPRGSLQQQLYSQDPTPLSFHLRLQIALDVANGLAYLHHGLRKQIVHRDVKPSNILLDENWVAKVADFGISKHLGMDEVHSKVRGTYGYVAPEYGESTRVDAKGDVFSFGIVVLELLTRKEPTDSMFGDMGTSLPNWVRDAHPGRYWEVMDPELLLASEGKDGDDADEAPHKQEALEALLEVALACVEVKPEQRPDMKVIVGCLTSLESNVFKCQQAKTSEM